MLLALNQDSWFVTARLVVSDDVLRLGLPPMPMFFTLLVPSVKLLTTRTEPPGMARYGAP